MWYSDLKMNDRIIALGGRSWLENARTHFGSKSHRPTTGRLAILFAMFKSNGMLTNNTRFMRKMERGGWPDVPVPLQWQANLAIQAMQEPTRSMLIGGLVAGLVLASALVLGYRMG